MLHLFVKKAGFIKYSYRTVCSSSGKYIGFGLKIETGTERTTIIVDIFNIVQKVRDTDIHLKVDEEQWKITQESKRKQLKLSGYGPHVCDVCFVLFRYYHCLHPFAFLCLSFFVSLEMSLFLSISVSLPFSLGVWRVDRTFFPSGWCFSININTLRPRAGFLASAYYVGIHSLQSKRLKKTKKSSKKVVDRRGKNIVMY